MTIEPSPEAIEAGGKALFDFEHVSDTDDKRAHAEVALIAALPALEQQIREQVAESIERKLCGCGNNSPLCEINNTHFTLAAQIARGKDQE